MRPLSSNIIMTKKNNNQTKSGILFINDTQENIAEVIAVGDECLDIHCHDQVVYKEFSTTKINLKDKQYIIIDQKDVLAVIEDNDYE